MEELKAIKTTFDEDDGYGYDFLEDIVKSMGVFFAFSDNNVVLMTTPFNDDPKGYEEAIRVFSDRMHVYFHIDIIGMLKEEVRDVSFYSYPDGSGGKELKAAILRFSEQIKEVADSMPDV